MADQKKQQNPKFTTPAGAFQFPKLFEPDTKYKDAGEYSVKLRLSEEAAAPLIAKLQPLFDAAVKAGEEEYKKLPVKTRKSTAFKETPFYSPVYDEESEEETGEVEFNFKMTASGVSKKTNKPWTRKPAVFDAKGKPILKDPEMWSGTVGKVNFEVLPYYTTIAGAGISLRLNAVQVIELRTGGAQNASAYGFEEEDGYEYEDDHGIPAGDDDETPPFDTDDEAEDDQSGDF
jgi:hypothetical protein